MNDVHVRQDLTTYCGKKNCAAASGSMAVAFGGGPVLSSDQFRALSGVSCVPGVDSSSGGLRATDVWAVAQSFGVTIHYGGLAGAIADWPVWALEGRLREGEGCIVLGDCKVAPTSPCATDELYHSAFVHGFRVDGGVEQTHWHDPRLSGASWQPLTEVITYWQGMDHGRRFAGFVAPAQTDAPPDTSTGGGVTAMAVQPYNLRSFSGTVTVAQDGVFALLPDGRTTALARGITKRATQLVTLPNTPTPVGLFNEDAYAIGDSLAYLLARNVTVSPDPGSPQPATPLGPGVYRVG